MTTTLVSAQAVASLCMVGVLWVMQLVHYPLMALVPDEAFAAYEDQHRRRISLIVGPTMAIEAVTALALVLVRPGPVPLGLLVAGVALLLVVLATTAFVSAPLHVHLSAGKDQAVIARLVATNWIRTVGWSGRGAVALAMVVLVMGA